MKCPTVYSVSVIAIAFIGWVSSASARPMDFSEVSLLVRAREPESSIINDVSQRKLVHSLTPQQESTLKSQGASGSLVQSLHNPNLVVSRDDAIAFEAQRDQQAKASRAARDSSEWDASENVRVFDVALGHPINLSQWGGYDYELAFYAYRTAGEDIVEPVISIRFERIQTSGDVFPALRTKCSLTIPSAVKDSCRMTMMAVDSRRTTVGEI